MVLIALQAICMLGCSRAPDDAAVKAINQGDSHLEQNELSQAITAYGDAISRDPSRVDAYYNRGVAHFKNEQYRECIADMEEVIAKDPKITLAHYYVGKSYASVGDMDKAIESFSRGIELNANEPLFLVGRAEAYKKLGRQPESEADLDKVRKLAPHLLEDSQ